MAQPATVKKSSSLMIAVAWIIVIVPTAWGLKYTVQNAMKLFTASTPAASSAPGSPSPPVSTSSSPRFGVRTVAADAARSLTA